MPLPKREAAPIVISEVQLPPLPFLLLRPCFLYRPCDGVFMVAYRACPTVPCRALGPYRTYRSCPAAGLEAGLAMVVHGALLSDPRLAQSPLGRQTRHWVRVQQGRDELFG